MLFLEYTPCLQVYLGYESFFHRVMLICQLKLQIRVQDFYTKGRFNHFSDLAGARYIYFSIYLYLRPRWAKHFSAHFKKCRPLGH